MYQYADLDLDLDLANNPFHSVFQFNIQILK